MKKLIKVSFLALFALLLAPTLMGKDVIYGYGSGIAVDSTSVTKGYAVADDTFSNGFTFKMTVTIDDSNEDKLRFKFADWDQAEGTGEIAADSNMKVCLDSGATTCISDFGNSYASGALTISDADSSTPGVQQDVYIFLKVPSGTSGGTYSSTYGVQSSGF